MRKIKIIFIIWLIIWTFAFAYLWILNRASEAFWEKILPALVVGSTVIIFTLWLTLRDEKKVSDLFWKTVYPALVAGIMGATFTLWFDLKDEKITINFPATLIYNEKSRESLENCDERYNLYNNWFCRIRGLIKAPVKKNKLDIYPISGFPQDVIFLETLTLLFTSPHDFDGYVIAVGGAGVHTSSEDPAMQYFPNQILTWQDFALEYLKNYCRPEINKLYSQIEDPNLLELIGIGKMCFPKGTTIKILSDLIIQGISLKHSVRGIILKNDFCEVKILIFERGGGRGIGEWKWILEYDDDKNNEFWSSNLRVYLSAKFNRFRSGHPDMPKYREWVDSMFNRIRSCLDSEEQLKIARERHHIYKDYINDWFKSEKLRQENLAKSNATVNENQIANEQTSDGNQPVK